MGTLLSSRELYLDVAGMSSRPCAVVRKSMLLVALENEKQPLDSKILMHRHTI